MTTEDWGKGYDAGTGVLLKAVETAQFLTRERIIKYIELNSPLYPKSKHEIIKLIKEMPVE